MLNALEPGTKLAIHRHTKSSETVVCVEGCFDEVFYEALPTVDCGGPVHNGEMALDETCFEEVARFRICPREGLYGIQIPEMACGIAWRCMSRVLSLRRRMGGMGSDFVKNNVDLGLG